MELILDRTYCPGVTTGLLKIPIDCFQTVKLATVELPWKGNKRNVSCIAEGEYIVDIHDSPKFGECLWVKMPDGDTTLTGGRTQILFHPANFTRELRGCIAPGTSHQDIDGDGRLDVKSSRDAMKRIIHIYRAHYVNQAKLTIKQA